MLLSADKQWTHSLHSPVKTGRTWSPGARSVTPSPTLSMILIEQNHKPKLVNLNCKNSSFAH